MDDKELNAELENLLAQERRKEARSYVESMDDAKNTIVEAFFDHIITTEPDLDTDVFAEDASQTQGAQKDRDLVLGVLIQKDIEKQGALSEGEIQVIGNLMYVHFSDDNEEIGVEQCEDDTFKLHGKANGSIVTPLEVFEDPKLYEQYVKGSNSPVTPGVWLRLRSASLYDEAGQELRTFENVLVPLNVPSMYFNKVMRRFSEITEHKITPEYVENGGKVDLVELITSDEFQELCVSIENDLNYNTYEPEERASLRRRYTDETADFLRSLEDFNDEISLTASDAVNVVTKEKRNITRESAYYNGFTIIESDATWRVVQTFTMVSVDKNGFEMFHVMPENIQKTQEN